MSVLDIGTALHNAHLQVLLPLRGVGHITITNLYKDTSLLRNNCRNL